MCALTVASVMARLGGDVFVALALCEHDQHPELLGRQCRQSSRLFAIRSVGPGSAFEHPGCGYAAAQDRAQRVADGFDARGLWNEARRAEIEGPLHYARIFRSRNNDDWNSRMLRSEIEKRRESFRARHAQVQKDQVGVRILDNRASQRVERRCLDDLRAGDVPAHRFLQCGAKERVVVRNDQCRRRHGGASMVRF
jgi:hypothetical protein